MTPAPRAERWLRWAAYATWLAVALPTIADLRDGSIDGSRALALVAAFAAFGALLPVMMRPLPARVRRLGIPLLALHAALGLSMMYLSRNGTAGATLVIVVAEAAAVLPPAGAWLWLAAQSILMGIVWSRFDTAIGGIAVAGAFAGFQAFAISTMSLARAERTARQELSRANAELIATRSLLAENSRVAERLRISRDLHDTLGPHLTALSLQLEVASRLSSGPPAEHVQQAHAITRLLLGDVRDVVSRLRDTSHVNLAEAIRTLALGAGPLEIHLDVPDPLELEDPAQAHALVRCVQEIITNAVRHGRASNLWVRIETGAGAIDLHARDDGRGAADLTWGNGLTGMRERFEEYDGRVEVTPGAGRGFELHCVMPRAGTTR